MKALLLALLVACTPPQRTTAVATVSTALIAADWYQTRTFITPECMEMNPVIGTCGEKVHPDVYFPIVIVSHIIIGAVLPKNWRNVWFAAIAGVQGHTVYSNYQKGY